MNSNLRSILLCAVTAALLSSIAQAGDRATTQSSGQAEVEAMDKNKDAKVSVTEHEAGAKAMFLAMDADKDRTVTVKEMDAYHAARATGEHRASDMSSAEKIKVIDTNGDGELSADEHAVGAHTMFEKMDGNKDGNLTAAEIDAGHAAMLKRKS